jgi:hypothetical protein
MTLENAENGSDSSNGRVLKIWAVAATVLEELGELRSAGPVGQEALEAEAARIAQERLPPHGCGLVVRRLDDGTTSFAMRVRGGEIRIRSRLEFLPTFRPINSKNGGMTYDPRS